MTFIARKDNEVIQDRQRSSFILITSTQSFQPQVHIIISVNLKIYSLTLLDSLDDTVSSLFLASLMLDSLMHSIIGDKQ